MPDSVVPPQGVQSAGKRALELIKAGRAGAGFTDVGRARAAQLASGGPVSPDTVRRMASYFARHAVDKKAGWADAGKETPGYVAWLAWGGDAGATWSQAMAKKWMNEK